MTQDKKDAALIKATEVGNYNNVQRLLDDGANIEAKNEYGNTVLISAISNSRFDIAELLIKRGANVNVAGTHGYTALIHAAARNRIDIVKLLMNNGANIDIATNDGYTALILAASNGHIDIAQFLINNGANIDIATNDGYTALIKAASNGHIDIVQLLINNGANIDIAENDGYTALIKAPSNGHIDIVQLLIDNGANINAVEKFGRTALILTASKGSIDMVQLLINNGALIPDNMVNDNSKINDILKTGRIADKIFYNQPLTAKDKIFIATDGCDGEMIQQRFLSLFSQYGGQSILSETMTKGTKLEAMAKELLAIVTKHEAALDSSGLDFVLGEFYNLGMFSKKFVLLWLEGINEKHELSIKLEDEDFFEKILANKDHIDEEFFAQLQERNFQKLHKQYLQKNHLLEFLKQLINSPNFFKLLCTIEIEKKSAELYAPSQAILSLLKNPDVLLTKHTKAALSKVVASLEQSIVPLDKDGSFHIPPLEGEEPNDNLLDPENSYADLPALESTEMATSPIEIRTVISALDGATASTNALGKNPAVILLENEASKETSLPPSVLFQGGILAGNTLFNPALRWLDDKITGENPDKNWYNYYAEALAPKSLLKFTISSLLSALGMTPAEIGLYSKLSGDLIAGEAKPTFEYAASNMFYMANYFAAFCAVTAAKHSEFSREHPFTSGIIISTSFEFVKIPYHLIQNYFNAEDHLIGKDDSSISEF